MNLEIEQMDTSKYLYKSNNLIESSYKFDLNEFRLTYLAIKKLTPIYIKSNIKRSEMRTVFGHETFKDIKISVNEFKNASLSNVFPENFSYAFFRRMIACAYFTFSHSLSSCGRSSIYKNLHFPVLSTIS